MTDELRSLGAECRGSYKYALVCPKANEAANEGLHVGATHLVACRVSFRLNIDAIKTKSILVDDTIDASVAGTAV